MINEKLFIEKYIILVILKVNINTKHIFIFATIIMKNNMSTYKLKSTTL